MFAVLYAAGRKSFASAAAFAAFAVAVGAAPSVAAATEIVVTVTRFKALDKADELSSGDFFARIRVDGKAAFSPVLTGQQEFTPNWKLTLPAKPGVVKVNLSLIDKDVSVDDPIDINRLDKKRELPKLRRMMSAWVLSNFLHGEQGALLAASQIVTAVPGTDAKFYAATQAMDEARHVEAYDRYLREKMEMVFPIFTQIIVDRVVVERDVSLLRVLAFGMAAVIFFTLAATVVQRYLLSFTAVRVDAASLDYLTRRLLVLTTTAALGRWEEFRLHVTAGLAHDLEWCDVEEVLLQVAVYAGVPAANTAFHIAQEVRAAQRPPSTGA